MLSRTKHQPFIRDWERGLCIHASVSGKSMSDFFSLSSLENFDVYNRMPPSNTKITTGAKLVAVELNLSLSEDAYCRKRYLLSFQTRW